MEDKNSIFHYYKKLIELRRKNDIFVYGNYEVILKDDEYTHSYLRSLDNEKLLVILNFSGSKRFFRLSDDIKFEYKELLISNYDVIDSEINAVFLKPYEARVYRLKSK